MARSAVSLAALYSLLRPPRAPFAASMIFFFRAWWATPFLTRGMFAPYACRRRLTRGKSAELTRSLFLSRFFRLRTFLVRMWVWLACQRFSLPVPVVLKRFIAARLVFCFGICSPGGDGPAGGALQVHSVYPSSPSYRLLRRDDHRHVAPFELRIRLDLAHIGQARGHSIQHRLAQLQVRDLPAAEHHGDLHLVSVAQELPRVPGLEVEVVVVDAGPVLHFLELDDVLLLLGSPGRLGFIELELPVVHDLDDGRPRGGRHFHEIQPAFLSGGKGLFDGQHAQLLAGGGDDAHRADADHPIDSYSLFAVVRGQWARLQTKRETSKTTGTRSTDRVPAKDAHRGGEGLPSVATAGTRPRCGHEAGRLRVGELPPRLTNGAS